MTASSFSQPKSLNVSAASAFLSETEDLRRLPRAPRRRRPKPFWDSFEDRAVFYDCFRHIDGGRVVLIGPPPLNLEPHMRAARFRDLPSGRLLEPKLHLSRSTLIVELADVEGDAIEVQLAGQTFVLTIGENLSQTLAGTRAMVTMNKDNDLDWIRGWADWHVLMHGVDAIIVFDNGSTRYGIADIEAALASVPDLKFIVVLDWPWRYGRMDPAVLGHPHYVHFLQVSSLNVTLRRLTALSAGLLNCDIDELVGTNGAGSAFDQLDASPDGLVTLKGRWVEPIGSGHPIETLHHARYRHVRRNPLRSICANKWIIDPSRHWLAPLEAKPSVHRIYDVDKSFGRRAPILPFWHFRAISTNWKEPRTQAGSINSLALKRAAGLDAEIARYAALASSR